MIAGCCALFVALLAPQVPDSLWYQRSAEHDLTGDGIEESLLLSLRGSRIDSLEVALQIVSEDSTIYRERWLSAFYFQNAPTALSDRSSAVERVEQEIDGFFHEDAFRNLEASDPEIPFEPDYPVWIIAFDQKYTFALDSLRSAGIDVLEAEAGARRVAFETPLDSLSARAIWRDVVARRAPTFTFSSGGEYLRTIAWSILDRRFHIVFACC